MIERRDFAVRRRRGMRRKGATMIMLMFCVIGLFGMLALAIEVGSIAIGRCQAQNPPDSAAMAGARTINGDSTANYNLDVAPTNAVKAAIANSILGSKVTGNSASVTSSGADQYVSGNVTILLGTYGYNYNDSNPSSEGFSAVMPRASNSTEPYSAVRATVTGTANLNFARLFGVNSKSVSATAVAVHRPRDVFIIMDLSGSMRFQSLPGIPLNGTDANPSSTTRPRTVSMNNESVYPQFGHYQATSAAALRGTSTYSTGSEWVDLCNISASSNSGPAICEDFYANAANVAPTASDRAFTRSADSQATTPGGYNFLKPSGNNGAYTNYAATVNEICNGTSYHANFETNGYSQYVTDKTSFYTEGPGYWGKTFFIWPPDPRGPATSTSDATNTANHANNGAKDWRKRFFFKYNTSTLTLGWLDHNTLLFNDPSSAAPATYSNPDPTPIMRYPGQTRTVTENGVSVTYSFRINYRAILHWLKNETPVHFPSRLRAGRICYYSAWPDVTDTTLNSRWWTTQTLTSANERLWRDYINFVLGYRITGTSNGYVTYDNTNRDSSGNDSDVPLSAMIGCGDYFKWGTTALQITQKPDGTKASSSYQTGKSNSSYSSGYTGAISVKNMSQAPTVGDYVVIGSSTYRVKAFNGTSTVTLNTGLASSLSSGTTMTYYRDTDKRYMDYNDNPYRPKHQYWFGPMTFVDWLGNYQTSNFAWPGNCHEAQAWACKVGIQTAIDDIKNNHPNDFLGMCFFSNPMTSRTDSSGYFNGATVALGRNYQQLKDSLWFPPSTITGTATEITPYDADMSNVPRAQGSTSPGMGFMICYNQLSSSVNKLRTYATPSTTYRGNAGGLGRKGATRIVVFETDGAPNYRSYAALSGTDSDAYYPIRIKVPNTLSSTSNVEWPTTGTYSATEVYDVVKQIVALDTASPPGFSQTRHTATVWPIGYGSLFDPTNASTAQTNALTFMQTVAYHGKTASNMTGSSFSDTYRIYGTNTQRITRMKNAFTNIMQSGTQVSLIE